MEEVRKISTTNELSLQISDNSTLYLHKKFYSDFEMDKFVMKIYDLSVIDETPFYNIKYAYSYDNISWSNPLTRGEWNFVNKDVIESNSLSFYLSVVFTKIDKDIENDNKPEKLREEKSVISNASLFIENITYDGIVLDITDENVLELVTIHRATEKYPKWNFYQGQDVTVARWLDQLVSVTQMYGHILIYFKTETNESNNTLSNNFSRNVTQVKKILFTAPNNELPADRFTYSEWDLNLDGDFTIQIVDSIFKTCFGKDKIPLTKDYVFMPILNKMWRINSVQPKVGFMGKTGMWEIGLAKFEKDSSITMSSDLVENYSDFDDFGKGIDFFGEVLEFEEDTVLTQNDIKGKTIEEKKKVTNNFSNKFIDSTSYTDIKETDAQREFYANRLNIISINPSSALFPITMYDSSQVDKNVLGLSYNLVDLTSNNKFNRIVDDLELSFDFVLLKRFEGEIFAGIRQDFSKPLSVTISRKNLMEIELAEFNFSKVINYVFDPNEFYGVTIKFNERLKQLSFVIYKLIDNIKEIVFQDLVIINEQANKKMELDIFHLYGGNFLSSNIKLLINKNEIIDDNCSPVLKMQNKYKV